MSLSSVDLPDPLTPIRPVRPGEKAAFRPDRTGVPSGQEKERSVQVIAEGMGQKLRNGKRPHAHGTGACRESASTASKSPSAVGDNAFFLYTGRRVASNG